MSHKHSYLPIIFLQSHKRILLQFTPTIISLNYNNKINFHSNNIFCKSTFYLSFDVSVYQDGYIGIPFALLFAFYSYSSSISPSTFISSSILVKSNSSSHFCFFSLKIKLLSIFLLLLLLSALLLFLCYYFYSNPPS